MPPTTTRLSFLPDFSGRDRLYRPLDAEKGEIRVITVLPSDDRSAVIRCSLQTISIQHGRSTKHYDAVSYYWGSAVKTENIIVYDGSSINQPYSDFEVPVTLELTGALRQFRARASDKDEPLVLWTDAVCINQLDAAERSQQVTIMRSVYESATSVLIWLGGTNPVAEMGLVNFFGLAMHQQANIPDSNHTTDAFDYHDFDAEPDLENLGRVDAMFGSFNKPGGYSSETILSATDLGADIESWIKTVSALFNVSYWYRGWTIQEACANERILLHYGYARCRVKGWEHVSNFLTAMPTSTSALEVIKCGQAVTTDQELADDLLAHVLTSDLEKLAYLPRQTADPRDQVYGLIGCMLGFMLLKLTPNYTMSVEQVFTATSLAILRGTQSWSHAQFFRSSMSPFMPSWAIDFTLLPVPLDDARFPNYEQKVAKFEADGNASFHIRELALGKLATAGFVYDDVVAVGSSGGLSTSDMRLREWSQLLVSDDNVQYVRRNKAYKSMADCWESFCRTLCAGTVKESKFGKQQASACQQRRTVGECILDDEAAFILSKMRQSAETHDYCRINFVITRKRHIGLAPSSINIGDHIAILGGSYLPFALRKLSKNVDGDAYVLLGGCYIDGIMYGEAVRERARSIFEARQLPGMLSDDLAFQDDICLV